MVVNVISDIHADYDFENNKVIYNAPYNFSVTDICEAAKALNGFFAENMAKFRELPFKNDLMNNMFDLPYITNVEQLADWVAAMNREIQLACIGLNTENVFIWSRVITVVEFFFRDNKLKWSYEGIDIDDIKTFLFKQMFDFDPKKLEPADVLLIAGDLGYVNTYDKILADIKEQTKGNFKHVLAIAGNHDHWFVKSMSKDEERPEAICLDNDYCELNIGEYAFLGCTLWTPLGDNWMQWSCCKHMNDYRYIPHFKIADCIKQYEIQSTWLRSKIAANAGKKIVVFTHHQPFKELIENDTKHNGWDGTDVSGAYAVLDGSLNDVNEHNNIMLWACGHTHMNYDGMLHGIHVVRNPIGYRDHYGWCYSPPENCQSKTWYSKLVEV